MVRWRCTSIVKPGSCEAMGYWPDRLIRPKSPILVGRRVLLRPLTPSDFHEWRAVRRASASWLEPWEPRRIPGGPDVVEDEQAFGARCAARQADQRNGAAYSFGLFADGRFAGEINVSQIFRGALQSCSFGYWVASDRAGQGLVPEGVVLALRFAFDELHLHRVEIGIVPRNAASLRIPNKLGLRYEGLAERFVEINGTWEDHYRFAITAEELTVRGDDLLSEWVY